jgi:hypothetical protein
MKQNTYKIVFDFPHSNTAFYIHWYGAIAALLRNIQSMFNMSLLLKASLDQQLPSSKLMNYKYFMFLKSKGCFDTLCL